MRRLFSLGIARPRAAWAARRVTASATLAGLTLAVLTLAGAALAGLAAAEDNALGEPLFPPELTRFVAREGEPAFAGAGEGRWDARLRERGWILREGDTWRLWYTGYDGTRAGLKMLGLATSRDGLAWERHPDNPLYREHWVEDMMIVRHDGVYHMFAEGRDDVAQRLTSVDGLRWRRVGPLDVRTTRGAPIEPGPHGTPTALVEDGLWRLFYERGDRGVWLATSRDMEVWTNVQDEPVLRPGPAEFDRELIALNQVVKHRARYYAYYHGAGPRAAGDNPPPRQWACGVAVSTDWIRWEKYPGNPLFPIVENKSSGVIAPLEDNRFRLYTMHDEVRVHEGASAEGEESRRAPSR